MGLLDFIGMQPSERPQGGLSGFLGGLPVMTGDINNAQLGLGLGLLAGGNNQEAFANALSGFTRGATLDEVKKKTRSDQDEKAKRQAAYGVLAQKYGLDPTLAQIPELAQATLKDRMAPKEPSAIERLISQLPPEKQGAAREAYLGLNKSQTRTSLTPLYGTDEQGNTVLLQPRDDGTLAKTAVPPGVKLSTGIDKIDAGTHWVLVDKRSGAVVGQTSKNIGDAAAEKEVGQQRGEAQAGLQKTLDNAQRAMKQIQEVEAHPSLHEGVWSGGLGVPGKVNRSIWGTSAYGLDKRVDQLKGGAFLEAFESLKGGGQITEAEGKKATEAIARLDAAQSEKDFRDALNDLKSVIQTGVVRARSKAGQGSGNAPVPQTQQQSRRLRFNPQTGELE